MEATNGWMWQEGIAARTAADTTDDVQRTLEKLESQDLANLITRLMANSSTGFRPFVLMASALLGKATLPATDREAMILGIAARSQLAYEWHEHKPVALRAGLTNDQLAMLDRADGSELASDLFSPSQVLAIRLSSALMAGDELSAADWESACAIWGTEVALELILSIAWWGGYVPIVIRGLGLRPDETA